MNTELFIARKMFSQKKTEGQLSKPVLRITVLAIALGIAVMIISISVLQGFQGEITKKISGFGAHIQIKPLSNNNSPEGVPFSKKQDFVAAIKQNTLVKNVQGVATKAAIVKGEEDIEGVLLKGVGTDFDWSYFASKLENGKILQLTDTAKSNEIMISAQTAARLKLKLGDAVFVYFIQQPPRMRKLTICGIYKTGLEEFDNKFAIADLQHLQKLNDWGTDSIASFEIVLNDFNELETAKEQISEEVPYDFTVQTIKEIYPQLFDWLGLQDMNVIVILVIMIVVCIINMVSALLILILERTKFIGMLKTMGARNWFIRKIFIYNAVAIIAKGMLWGNLFGIGLCVAQYYFKFIELDEASYYVKYVPVLINPIAIVLVNLGTLLVCSLAMVLPSVIVTKITPIKAIRFS